MKPLLLSLIVLASLSLNAQNYQIIKVKGMVKLCESEKLILQGDKIDSGLPLCFTNTEQTTSALAVLDLGDRQRYLLKEGNSKETMRIRSRAQSSGNYNSSPSNMEEEFERLSYSFGSGDYLILDGEVKKEINHIPLNAQSYFSATYTYHGKNIFKRLSFDGSSIIIGVNELFSIDGVPISREEVSEVSISYLGPHAGSNYERKITTFRPHFAVNTDIKKELAFIIELEGENPNWPDLESKLAGYLMDVYGQTDEKKLFAWLHKHYGRFMYRN